MCSSDLSADKDCDTNACLQNHTGTGHEHACLLYTSHRLGFYARNGAKTAGYETALFGVPYKTLYWSKKPVDDSVLMEQHRHIYESRFSPEKLDRFIRIPYDPAEPLVATPWEE